jgi:predicted RNase H-like nuclease (RuvC/YqgF family)
MSLLTDILKEIPLSAVLREKISALEAQNAELQTEIAILKDDLRQAKTENKRLKSEIQQITHPVDLDEAKTQLLIILAKRTKQISVYEFLKTVEIERVHLEYHLYELMRQGYVTATPPKFPDPQYFLLTQKGREYLLEKYLV